MLDGLRKFIMRGNMVDLAVGVVVGAAFGSVVTALVKDLLTPLIAALVKTPDFSDWKFEFRGATFLLGDFLNSLIAFLLVVAAVYFFVVVPVSKILARWQKTPTVKKCPHCFSDIPIKAKRCPHCTSQLGNIGTRQL